MQMFPGLQENRFFDFYENHFQDFLGRNQSKIKIIFKMIFWFSKKSKNHFRFQQKIKKKIIFRYEIMWFLNKKHQNEMQKSTILGQNQSKSFFPVKNWTKINSKSKLPKMISIFWKKSKWFFMKIKNQMIFLQPCWLNVYFGIKKINNTRFLRLWKHF